MASAKKKIKLNKKQRMIAVMIGILIIIAITVILVLTIKRSINQDENEPVNENFSFLVDEESSKLDNLDLFETQNDTVKELLSDYKKNDYTIDNPKFVQNPFLISPMTGLIMFKTSKKEKVTLTIKGKNNDDLVTTFEASKDHYIPVYGLYQNYKNVIKITTESGKSHEITVELGQMLESADVDVIQNDVGNSNGEFYFGTTAIGVASIAYDNYGEVRWFFSEDYSKGMTMLQNGHILLSDTTEGSNIVSTGGVIELDMLGYIHNQYEFEGGYHHDALELKDGNLLVLSSDEESSTIADVVYELDRETGQVIKTIDIKKIMTAIDPDLIDYGEISWGWLNGIDFDYDTNELILSLRNRNSIIAIDYDTNELKWILGEEKFWSSKFSSYILKGEGDDFIYPRGPHSPVINSSGNLSIFNNGYNAYKESSVSCSSLKYNESYAIEYNIDRTNKTAKIVYKFGGQKYFSYALSSYNYTYNNHRIFNSGWHFSDESIYNDSTCTQFTNDKYDSYIIEFNENNEKIFEMRVNESKFEVVKAPIYNLEAVSVAKNKKKIIENYSFDSDAGYLTNKTTSSYEILSMDEAAQYANNESNYTALFLMNNRLKFNGSLPTDIKLTATAISPKGTAYKFTLKEAGSDDMYVADLNELPSGRYYIFITLDDDIYNTNQYVEIEKE